MNHFIAPGPRSAAHRIIIVCLLSTFWMYATLPNTVNLLLGGRGIASGSGGLGTIVETGVGGAVRWALLIVVTALAVMVIAFGISRSRWQISTLIIAVLFATAVSLVYLSHTNFEDLVKMTPAYLVFCSSMVSSYRATAGKVLGVLTGMTALLSILWGFFQPTVALMNQWDYGEDKKIFDSGLLAGPFTHSNILGIALVIGLPWITYVRRSIWKYIFLVSSVTAIIWSASRSSIVVMTMMCLFAGIICFVKSSSLRIGVARITVLGAIGVGIVLPLLTTSESAVQGRGWIWQASRMAVLDSPLLGSGQPVFVSGAVADIVGYNTSHGHNIYMTALARDGIIGFIALTILLLSLGLYASRLASATLAPVLSILVFLVVGMVEMSFSVTSLEQNAGFAWLAMVAIISTSINSPRLEVGLKRPVANRVAEKINPTKRPDIVASSRSSSQHDDLRMTR